MPQFPFCCIYTLVYYISLHQHPFWILLWLWICGKTTTQCKYITILHLQTHKLLAKNNIHWFPMTSSYPRRWGEGEPMKGHFVNIIENMTKSLMELYDKIKWGERSNIYLTHVYGPLQIVEFREGRRNRNFQPPFNKCRKRLKQCYQVL